MALFAPSVACVYGGLGLWMIASMGVPMTYWFHAFVGGLLLGIGIDGIAIVWWTLTTEETR